MRDFLWDSPVYQEIITEAEARGEAKGVETGKLQALSEMSKKLLNFVDMRFPALRKLAQQCISQIDDNATLLRVAMGLSAAQNVEEARKVLTAKPEA